MAAAKAVGRVMVFVLAAGASGDQTPGMSSNPNVANHSQSEPYLGPTLQEEAVEWPALRKVRVFFLLTGLLNMVLGLIIAFPNAEFMESKVLDEIRVSKNRRPTVEEKARVKQEISQAEGLAKWVGGVGTAIGLLIFICGLTIFRHPFACCLTGTVIYGLGLLGLFLAPPTAAGLAIGGTVRLGVLVGLIICCITAVRCERDYYRRRYARMHGQRGQGSSA